MNDNNYWIKKNIYQKIKTQFVLHTYILILKVTSV